MPVREHFNKRRRSTVAIHSEYIGHWLLRIWTQINAILRVIERDERGKLDVKTFLDRFQVL